MLDTVTPSDAIAAFAAPDSATPQAPHTEFLGMRFCLSSQADVIRRVIEAGAPYRYVVTPNAYHIAAAHDEPARLLPVYRAAWLSLCDSRIVRALARLEGRALPLVTGSDLVPALFAALNAQQQSSRQPKRILVVGPAASVAAKLRTAYPNVNCEVIPAPSALAHNAALRLAVARSCRERQWDIALLCVGCPAQELIAQELAELGATSGVALCVGASIDFLTGTRTRAPRWLQRFSLEWAYRLAQEPRRLWRRYLVESPKILRIFIASRSPRGR
jgi:N-acetylglucosaminyldiphosphoundecaprenol N-acetyl-beta-D-mannosaminyltransferase